MTRGCALIIALWSTAAQAQEAPDAAALVRMAFESDWRGQTILQQYTYQQTTTVKRYDSKGNLKESENNTYDILLVDGSEARRHVSKDGQPLQGKDKEKAEKSFQETVDKRQKERPSDRAKRLRERERDREEQRRSRDEISKAFRFEITAEETIGGIPCYRISAEPRKEYRPQSKEGKILPKMRGVIWVSKQDPEWIQIEAETTGTISFGWVLARLAPGAKFQIRKARVNDELWHPAWVRIRVDPKIGLVKTLHLDIENRYDNFRKFSVDSRIVAMGEDAAPPAVPEP